MIHIYTHNILPVQFPSYYLLIVQVVARMVQLVMQAVTADQRRDQLQIWEVEDPTEGLTTMMAHLESYLLVDCHGKLHQTN